ncbi:MULTISPECIES: ABC transporter substrate-binding protein [unclassified Streptomyces]|uniref:ABC transporter substrate-binding protein n=1 Tax=unclassified Streptomyces TaxID=2593676 RepID=UPI000DB93DB5|nr:MULTISPECIES: ABC transporter substrate-binding protein [unclassified Streptomyces]MYT75561.1 aliphatic sulfonate ABC transporter substrate-binding protein [Streptomyces sp. SID8367]RAJ86967.1 sulfonate transport system substrate-binding protein [Streptomyces sp. PsTaAH-137]
MRRLLPLPALLTPLALLLAACSGASSATTSTAGAGGGGTDGKGSLTLNVGDQKGGSEAVLRAAGELDDLDYKIRWSTFTSGPPLLEAVNAKAVDIGGVGNTPPVFAAGADSKIKVVSASHGTAKGDTILVPKDSSLRTPSELKGKSIAVAQGSSAHYQLVASLKKAGLGFGDVKVKYLQPADALAAFTGGKVDAWAVWDPYTSQVLRAKQGRVLTDGDGVTNGLAFQVASPTALADKKKSAAIKDYLDRLRRAQNWVYKHPEEWAKVWAKDTGLPYDVALDAVKRTNGTRVTVAIDKDVIASEQQIADAFTELKLIPRKVDFSEFVDTRFNGDLPASSTAPRTYAKES